MRRSKARVLRCYRARSGDELERLVKQVKHCRLETHPEFFDFFVEGCQFKPVSSPEASEVAAR